MATPTIREAVEATGTTATVTATTAAGTQVDDWLIAFHQTNGRAVGQLTTPTGTAGTWTAIIAAPIEATGATGVKMHVWRRKVTTGGAQTITTGTGTAGQTNSLIVLVIDGADLTNPIDGTPDTANAVGGTSELVGPITTVGSDSLLVGGWGAHSSSSVGTTTNAYTAPSGMTESAENNLNANNAQMVASQALVAAGATGTKTATTISAALTGWVGILFAIKADSQVLTGTGISSAEAFGAHTLTPGPMDLTGTGIPSAGAFGSARVDHELLATGIPSVAAFGSSLIHSGLGATGLPSAEAFGTAVLTPGPVTLTATGIPHTHPFGNAVLLGSVLQVIGIPSALAFGNATLIVGDVTLTATGIPHTHPFGLATLTRSTSALTTEIVIRPKPRVNYELMVVARIPNAWTLPTFVELEALSWSTIKYGQKLSTPDTLDATVKASTLTEPVKQRLRSPDEIATELWLYRNGKRVFGGPMIGGSMNGEDLTLHANGCLAYLQWMHVRGDIVFKNTDQFQIVKRLIDQWGEDTFGNFGIDTSNIGFSGITMDITYMRRELNEVYERVMDLSKGVNGFDISVDPVNRNLELFYPSRGVDRSEGPEAVIFDDRNVTDTNISFSIGPKDLATVVMATGTGSGQNQANNYIMAYQDTSRLPRVGRIGYTATFRDVTSQVQMDRLTLALLWARERTLWVPGPNVRVTPDADLDSYDVGDRVSYHLHNELDIKGSFKLLARDIDVDENSNESISATFV